MNKSLICVGFLMLFIVIQSPLIISQVDIDYYIIQNKVLVELNVNNSQGIELEIPINSRIDDTNLEKSEYQIIEKDNKKIIKFNEKENFYFKYITGFYIEETLKINYFQVKNPLNKKSNVTLYLSEGFNLNRKGILFPQPEEITSDGKRIILKWNNFEEEQIIVAYNKISSQDVFIYYVVALIIFLIFIIYFFQIQKYKKQIKKIQTRKKRERKKQEREITKNLVKDEKRIIEYLLDKKNKESWTKEIVKDLGIGKVKLTRKLRNLEEKGLIKKIPYGNENKIILKK
ncbi:MAG: helix-turn-helix transcriptional regulator [Nanoarchaeota archaeon]